jgi:hypothetical protein
MEKLSNILETYIREEPTRDTPPKSELVQQIEEFANNKDKRLEVIKAFTQIEDHPKALDMGSDVGSAFDKEDLDEELKAAFEAIGEGGMIYSSFEHSFWLRHKGQLLRVM